MQWEALSAGGYHTCGVSKQDETKNNMIKCWGLVDDGQIGWLDGRSVLGVATPALRRPSAGSHVLAVVAAALALAVSIVL
jgi:hypothetical protein